MKHNKIVHLPTLGAALCNENHPASKSWCLIMLFGFLCAILIVVAVIPTAALAVNTDRALVLYEFELETGSHFVVLNIFDTPYEDADMVYLAGIKFQLAQDGQPKIYSNNDLYKKNFITTLIGDDHDSVEKIRKIQRLISVNTIDGDWGEGTWKALIEYIHKNSDKTESMSAREYRIINILHDDLEDEDLQVLENIINNQALPNQLPLQIVRRAYNGGYGKKAESHQALLPPADTIPAFKKTKKSIPDNEYTDQQRRTEYGSQKSPIQEKIDLTNADEEKHSNESSLLEKIMWVLFCVVCVVLFIWVLVVVKKWLRVEKNTNITHYGIAHREYSAQAGTSPSYRSPTERVIIMQLTNRVEQLQQTQARNLEATNKINGLLEDKTKNVEEYLRDVSNQLSKLDGSVQVISERLSKIETDVGAQINGIKFEMNLFNSAISEGLFGEGGERNRIPVWFDINNQLNEIRESLDRMKEKNDTKKDSRSNELSANHMYRKMSQQKEGDSYGDSEVKMKSVSDPNLKINFSDY